jgi:hypothetical protein
MPRSTKTVTTEPQQVDVDGDGDIDAIVSHTATITIEDEDCPPTDPQGEPGPTPRASGECGETACWSRTALTFTESNAGLTYTFTPPWPGNIAWDFGDASPVVVGRGPVEHTYAGAGDVTVKASPIASACLKSGTKAITVA